MLRLLLILYSILGFGSSQSFAIPSYDLTEEGLKYEQIVPFEYLIHVGSDLFQDIANRSDWQLSQTSFPKNIRATDTLWLRYAVVNRTNQSTWALVGYRSPNVDRNDFYLQNSRGEAVHTTFPKSRNDRSRWYDFIPGMLFEISPGESAVIYIRQQGGLTPSNRFDVMAEDKYAVQGLIAHLLLGTYMASGAFSFILSLMFFLAFRDRFYFAYSVYSTSFLTLALVNPGIWNALFRAGTGIEGSFIEKAAELIPIFPGIYMAQLFLATRRDIPRLHKIMNLVSIASLMFLFIRLTLSSIDVYIDQIALSACHAMTLATVLFGCWIKSRQGNRGAMLFFASWSVLAISVIIWGITMLGWLPGTFWFLYAPFWGQSLEFIILTMATIERIFVLHKSKIEAEATSIHRDNLQVLMRVIIHDLLNPLAIIGGVAEINVSKQIKGVEPNRADWSKTLLYTRHLIEIIEHVRTMQMLNDGKNKIVSVPLSLADACREVTALLEDKIQEKSLKVALHFEGASDLMVMAERSGLIHQVLTNVVSNAIKFSYPGGMIRIRGRATGTYALLDVIDQGMGIPDDIAINLFNPRASTSRKGTCGEKGTGYGMPLVKAYMDRFQGTIFVQSKDAKSSSEDHGTMIRLKFKCAEISVPAADCEPSQAS